MGFRTNGWSRSVFRRRPCLISVVNEKEGEGFCRFLLVKLPSLSRQSFLGSFFFRISLSPSLASVCSVVFPGLFFFPQDCKEGQGQRQGWTSVSEENEREAKRAELSCVLVFLVTGEKPSLTIAGCMYTYVCVCIFAVCFLVASSACRRGSSLGER